MNQCFHFGKSFFNMLVCNIIINPTFLFRDIIQLPLTFIIKKFLTNPIKTCMLCFVLLRLSKILEKYVVENPNNNNVLLFLYKYSSSYNIVNKINASILKITNLILSYDMLCLKNSYYKYFRQQVLKLYIDIVHIIEILLIGISLDINTCINYIFNNVVLPCVLKQNPLTLMSMMMNKPNQLPKSNFTGVEHENNPLLIDSDSDVDSDSKFDKEMKEMLCVD